MIKRKRVAVYGGTFNPIHNGHLALAEHILDHEIADEVLFMPTPDPPHKPKKDLATFVDRCNMIWNAIDGSGYEEVMHYSKLEEELPKPSYTLQTLDALSSKMLDKDYMWVIGADELNSLHTWDPDPIRLVRSYEFITFLRKGVSVDLSDLNAHWPGWICQRLLNGVVYDADLPEISSTAIRQYIKEHNGVDEDMVPHNVSAYISKYQLYGFKSFIKLASREIRMASGG